MSRVKRFKLRTWSTPLTIGSFTALAVSGVLMFFDVVPGHLSFAHEVFSWFFLLGTGAHVVVNYRPFLKHLRSGWGRACLAIFATTLIVSMFSFGRITPEQLKWPIAEALTEAPLSILADMTRTDHAELLSKLETHGISAELDQCIKDVARDHKLDEFQVLGLIMLRE